MANNFSSDITDMDEAASELIRYARLATEATSRFEDGVVDTGFESAVRAPLDKGEDAVIETALNRLKEEESPAYEELLSMAEDCAQTRVDAKGVHLLVLIPIMCWSRYLIPHGKISNEALKATAELFQKGWATEKATVQIGDCLLSADHLPEGLADVRHLLDRLTKKTKTGIVDIAKVVTTTPPPDFADVRYLALGVSAPDTASLFHPLNQSYEERARTVMDFCLGVREILQNDFIGTMIDVQPPASFFSGWRQADATMRIFAVRSLVDYVCCMGYRPADLIATTAVFTKMGGETHEGDGDEIRVSISVKDQPSKVVAGVVAPSMPEDNDNNQTFIGAVLDNCRVGRIIPLTQTFPMEWCEECGAPLYANPEGYVCHIEPPAGLDESKFAPTLN